MTDGPRCSSGIVMIEGSGSRSVSITQQNHTCVEFHIVQPDLCQLHRPTS